MSISVVVADNQPLVHAGLAEMFRATAIRIVSEAHTADEAVTKTLSLKPDVLLVEAQLGEEDGLAVVEKLRRKMPDLRVVIHTGYDNPRLVSRAAEAGAVDYLLKNCARQVIVDTVKRAATAESLDPQRILERFGGTRARGKAPVVTLTDRELQVVKHLALGLSNRDIGKALGISVETVKEHVQNILRKIDGTDRTQAAVWAVRKGLV